MKLEQLKISSSAIKVLEDKKIVSAEALLRKPPLHYYDFSETLPLTLESQKTVEYLEKHRPFAICGVCTSVSISVANHAKMLKLKIEDEATRNNLTGAPGTTLYVNVLGLDQFKQKFLSQEKDSPHRIKFNIPDDIPLYYDGESRTVNPSCLKSIEFINSLDNVGAGDLISLKTGKMDGWSRTGTSVFDERIVQFVTDMTNSHSDVAAALKWYGRGLRLDLAIKKVLIDDENLLKRMLFGKRLLVGGFIEYSVDYHTFSLLNPAALSTDIERFSQYEVQYSQMKGITPEKYKEYIDKSISLVSSLDFIPENICAYYNVPSFKDSAVMMHHPKSYRDIKLAEKRATVEDLLYFALKLERLNGESKDVPGVVMNDCSLIKRYTGSLPYELTNDQKKCINELCRQAASGKSINALVQGDVGTGKTAVAFCMLFLACQCGYQSALAVPYTTLAYQHYRDMAKISEALGITAVFLTSDIKGKKRKEVLEKIKDGTAQIIIGTHSIFSKEVEYKNLALIISDEEHKFGVVHRESLEEKAVSGCHKITMSATPIPKSIAATLYNDSVTALSIVEKPANRIPVQTAVIKKDITALNFMKEQIEKGHQCYVVCPSIDKNDKASKVASIEEKEKIYRSYLEPYGISLSVLTGKLKTDEKQKIMEDFTSGKTDVLMATTVIEVGINVPNATVITITGAERFGFSTLHQLRGRVGRGSFKSYCILQTDESNEKLEFMCKTTDGFEIAQKDLELRGPGSLFGEKQSGDNYYVSLMLANQELFKQLKQTAKYLHQSNTGNDIIRRYEEIFRSEEER